jgi:DNA polymerase III subunit delta
VDQAVTRVAQTIEALQTLPFFGEKLVWLKSASFLGDTVTGRSDSMLEAAERLLEVLSAGLPDGVRFLLSATEIDKRRTFYKTLSKLAEVEVFDRVDSSRAGWEDEARDVVRAKARECGLRFSEEALELFTLFCGADSRVIGNELEKLDLYLGAGRREVGAEEVRLLVPRSRAGVVFELGNAMARRDLPECLALIDRLLAHGENGVGILLAAVVPTARNLLMVKELMQRHRLAPPSQPYYFGKTLERLPPEAVRHLPRKKDGSINAYPLGLAASRVGQFTVAELRELLEACLHANVQMFSGTLDERTILSELVSHVAPRGCA